MGTPPHTDSAFKAHSNHEYVRDDISQLSFYPEGHVSVTFKS